MDKPEYLPIDEAARALGEGYSRSSILRRIAAEEWIEGIHWINDRRNGSAYRRIVRFHKKWRGFQIRGAAS
jgi:hypothetical protein